MSDDTRPCNTCGTPVARSYRIFPKYCSDDCKPRCSVEGCEGPKRKRGWCASHYAQWKRTGVDPVPFKYKWAERTDCLFCGGPTGEIQSRQFCSGNCRFWYYNETSCSPRGSRAAEAKPAKKRPTYTSCFFCRANYGEERFGKFCNPVCRASFHKRGGPLQETTNCVSCNVEIDLASKGTNGRRKRREVKLCPDCRGAYQRYGASAKQLAQRDGTDCALCGEPVDMSLKRTESIMSPSVDHIIPVSLGGGHEESNLQLAHLRCNIAKSNRVMPVT